MPLDSEGNKEDQPGPPGADELAQAEDHAALVLEEDPQGREHPESPDHGEGDEDLEVHRSLPELTRLETGTEPLGL